MRALVALLLTLVLAVPGHCQQREATVQLDDGRVLTGTVVAMDLESLRIAVAGEEVTLPALRIRSCRFHGAGEAGGAAQPAPEPVPTGSNDAKPPAPRAAPREVVDPIEVTIAAALDPESAPHDLRHRSLLKARISAFDEAFPWLCPAAPLQWCSLGCALFALLSLVVYMSLKVTGVEAPGLGRCIALVSWYMVTGFVQVAAVPVVHLSTVAMLVGNTVFALFWVRLLFGTTRFGAVLALAVQLGFVLLGYGTLELADAVMLSVKSAHA